MSYLLSATGANITWTEWKKHGGRSLSPSLQPGVSSMLGAEPRWRCRGVTTGDIAGVSIQANRELAQDAVDRWARMDLVIEEAGEL